MSEYHKLPIEEKRRRNLATVREPSMQCPICNTGLMSSDMLTHLKDRCPGVRPPGAGAKWITWAEALQLVPRRTFQRWLLDGLVRAQGSRGDRFYLLWDVVQLIAERERKRRRRAECRR